MRLRRYIKEDKSDRAYRAIMKNKKYKTVYDSAVQNMVDSNEKDWTGETLAYRYMPFAYGYERLSEKEQDEIEKLAVQLGRHFG